MTTTKPTPPSHLHAFNFQTGHPRFHFDEASDAAAASAAATAAAAAAAAAAGTKPWHDGVDADTIGHAQNKGWKLDNPKDAFAAAAKVARDLEKHFGVPADRLVKLPAADAKTEDLRAFYERLGAPKEAKDYDLSPVKDTGVAESMRAAMHAAGLTKDAAAMIAKATAGAIESKATSDATVNNGRLAEQKAELAKNWGDKFEYNRLMAMEGARRLGMSREAVDALESQLGYPGVMETLRKIGANTREDTFVERGVSGTGEVTTREGAIARKADLMADKAWAAKYLAGDPASVREMTRINTMIDGEAA